MQRLLTFFSSNYDQKSFDILSELRGDLLWWSTFLTKRNGFSLLPKPIWVSDPIDLSVDACDSGCGGFFLATIFTLKYLKKFAFACHIERAPECPFGLSFLERTACT